MTIQGIRQTTADVLAAKLASSGFHVVSGKPTAIDPDSMPLIVVLARGGRIDGTLDRLYWKGAFDLVIHVWFGVDLPEGTDDTAAGYLDEVAKAMDDTADAIEEAVWAALTSSSEWHAAIDAITAWSPQWDLDNEREQRVGHMAIQITGEYNRQSADPEDMTAFDTLRLHLIGKDAAGDDTGLSEYGEVTSTYEE